MRRLTGILLITLFSCGDQSDEIINCEDLTIILNELEYTDCGGSNGTLHVFANGGREPYAFRLNNGKKQTDNLFTGLESNYYTIYVEDANGCQDSVRTFLGSVEAVKAIALTKPSGCGTKDGSIKVLAKNGKPPYRYQLGENANYTNNDTFTGLGAGSYSVWVKDERDCFLGIYPVVLSGVTLEEAKGILIANCTSSGCHDSSSSRDLAQDETIKKYSKEIAEVIGKDHKDISLMPEEIELIVCWANDIELESL